MSLAAFTALAVITPTIPAPPPTTVPEGDGCTGLNVLNPFCQTGELGKSVAAKAFEWLAANMLESMGRTLASMGTLWVHVPTPGIGGESSTAVSGAPGGASQIDIMLGYAMWVSLVIAVGSLMVVGARMAFRSRSGDGDSHLGRLGVVFLAALMIALVSRLVGGAVPATTGGASPTVAWLQGALAPFMLATAMLSVIIGAAQMAWHQRAEPGKRVAQSILQLIVVITAGAFLVQMGIAVSNAFSVWVLDQSLDCSVSDNACFGTSMMGVLMPSTVAFKGVTVVIVLVLGLMAMFASIVQIAIMIARGPILVVLVATLPWSAAATNTEMGKAWFRKHVGWIIAFLAYKPAAAIVYAAGFRLVADGADSVIAFIWGVMLMIISLFTLPALVRLVVPATGGMGSDAGSGAFGAALATGAMMLGGRGLSSLFGGGGSDDATGAGTTDSGGDGDGGGGLKEAATTAGFTAATGGAAAGAGASTAGSAEGGSGVMAAVGGGSGDVTQTIGGSDTGMSTTMGAVGDAAVGAGSGGTGGGSTSAGAGSGAGTTEGPGAVAKGVQAGGAALGEAATGESAGGGASGADVGSAGSASGARDMASGDLAGVAAVAGGSGVGNDGGSSGGGSTGPEVGAVGGGSQLPSMSDIPQIAMSASPSAGGSTGDGTASGAQPAPDAPLDGGIGTGAHGSSPSAEATGSTDA